MDQSVKQTKSDRAIEKQIIMTDRRHRAAKWAFLAHYARMLGVDGDLLEERRKQGQMTITLVRDIAEEYLVTRTIPKVGPDFRLSNSESYKVKDHHRHLITTALNEIKWDADIRIRAKQCCDMVDRLKEQMKPSIDAARVDPINFASGISKLSWFDQPAGWTIYDSYAFKALRIKGGKNTVEAMQLFYDALAERGFAEIARQIDEVLIPLGIQLHATKVVDHFLMACAPAAKTDFCAANERAGKKLERQLLPVVTAPFRIALERVETILLESRLTAY